MRTASGSRVQTGLQRPEQWPSAVVHPNGVRVSLSAGVGDYVPSPPPQMRDARGPAETAGVQLLCTGVFVCVVSV